MVQAGGPVQQRGVQTTNFKLVQDRVRGSEQLYDLRQDPQELQDQSQNPALREQREHLRTLLQARFGERP